jgi:alpha-L-rhamnosidase
VRRARLYATALGAYEPWLNGERVGDARMTPEITDPSKHVLYQAYDVTGLIDRGTNMLGFLVGDGIYGGKYSSSGRYAFGPAPCRLQAQLEIEYADGERMVVATGPDWQIADAAILENSIYDGEVHDARLERTDWSSAGASDAGWRPATTAPDPEIPIDPQRCPTHSGTGAPRTPFRKASSQRRLYRRLRAKFRRMARSVRQRSGRNARRDALR